MLSGYHVTSFERLNKLKKLIIQIQTKLEYIITNLIWPGLGNTREIYT